MHGSILTTCDVRLDGREFRLELIYYVAATGINGPLRIEMDGAGRFWTETYSKVVEQKNLRVVCSGGVQGGELPGSQHAHLSRVHVRTARAPPSRRREHNSEIGCTVTPA